MKLSGYFRPTSLDEAFRLVREHPGARWIAGGTDLFGRHRPTVPGGDPAVLISLRRIPELRGIDGDDVIRVGAATPLADLAASPVVRGAFPALAAAARAIGSPQIRSVGTVGGNISNASPCADLAPPLLAAGARVEIRAPGGGRVVALEEFFVGPKQTCLQPGEVITAVLIDRPDAVSREVFLRRGRVRMDLAQVSLAVRLELRGGRCRAVRIAAGAVAPTPRRLVETERLLEGGAPDGARVAAAAEQARCEIAPISDLRASAEYRRRLTGVFLARAIERLTTEDRR